MASSLVQFRYEDSNRIKAASICERLGMDLPTYMRMALNRLIQENGVPFPMTLDDDQIGAGNRALAAMKKASRIAEENGIADMTLDEINAEIAEARK